jgi:hypothetical protein
VNARRLRAVQKLLGSSRDEANPRHEAARRPKTGTYLRPIKRCHQVVAPIRVSSSLQSGQP